MLSRRPGGRFNRGRVAAGGPPAFSPLQVTGLVLWLRADLGITTVSGKVSAWTDQSGTGDSNKDVTQGTAANRPTYNATDAGYNNQSTLTFDGTDDWMASGVWSTVPTTTGTFFIVGEMGLAATQVMSCMHDTGGLGELYGNGGGVDDLQYYQGATLVAVGESGINSKSVFAVERNGASTKIYQNAKTAITTGNAGSGALQRLILGSNALAASLPLNGKIAEVLDYNVILSAGNRGLVMDYLGARYSRAIGA